MGSLDLCRDAHNRETMKACHISLVSWKVFYETLFINLFRHYIAIIEVRSQFLVKKIDINILISLVSRHVRTGSKETQLGVPRICECPKMEVRAI